MRVTVSRMTASTVPAMIAHSIDPRTLRRCKNASRKKVATKTKIGQPISDPPTPSCTSGLPGRTMPASASPTSVMNRPIPTLIATRRFGGTARKTASRKPVSTNKVITAPSMTTSPMACGHVMIGAIT